LVGGAGDGLPAPLESGGGGQARLWPNLGDCPWGRPRSVGALPLFGHPEAPIGLADLDGDGVSDVVRLDGRPGGYIPRRPTEGFGRPGTLRLAPHVPPPAPRTPPVDPGRARAGARLPPPAQAPH